MFMGGQEIREEPIPREWDQRSKAARMPLTGYEAADQSDILEDQAKCDESPWPVSRDAAEGSEFFAFHWRAALLFLADLAFWERSSFSFRWMSSSEVPEMPGSSILSSRAFRCTA